ncbi:MAG TPA: hypothetical protein VFM70_04645 [Salinimicrobium sp.]|nr:hypothetical protein [Salinimicrobium sp.]
MRIDNKIKAYTLTEIIIVLILTSIVVGLAFSVLSLVQTHIYDIQKNFERNTEVSKLEQSLEINFNRYGKMDYDAMEGELTLFSAIDSISYNFHPPFIVKGTDTFKISTSEIKFFLKGNEVIEGNIDALKITCSKDFQNQVLFIYKEVDATDYFH